MALTGFERLCELDFLGFYRDRDGPGSARPLRDEPRVPGYSTLPDTGQTASSGGYNRVWLARVAHIAGLRSAASPGRRSGHLSETHASRCRWVDALLSHADFRDQEVLSLPIHSA
jgi:hypothetical protein